MSRWQQDAVDFACEAWAFQWVELFAREPIKASQCIGRLASTLGLDGGGSNLVQVYPEMFFGDGLLVACIIKYMGESPREMLWRHYVERWYDLRDVAVKTPDGNKIFEHTTIVDLPRDLGDAGLEVTKTKAGVSAIYRKAQFLGPGKPMATRIVDRSKPKTRELIERRVRPVKQRLMADRIGISRAEYHSRRDVMKSYVRGALDSGKCLDSKVGHETPAFV